MTKDFGAILTIHLEIWKIHRLNCGKSLIFTAPFVSMKDISIFEILAR